MEASIDKIEYFERSAVVEILKSHSATMGNKMRAFIVFGDAVNEAKTYDVDLLEVLEEWSGPRHLVFQSSSDLRFRGVIRLNFLISEEFERPESIHDERLRDDVNGLLRRVRRGYVVMREAEKGYADSVLQLSAPIDWAPSDAVSTKHDPRDIAALSSV